MRRFLFAAILCGVGYLLVRQWGWSVWAQPGTGRLAYTVFMTETVTRVGGEVGASRRLVTAVRADGSEMTAYLPPVDEKFARELHLTKQRVHTMVWDAAGMMTSTPMRLDWLSRPRPDPGRNCVADFAGNSMYMSRSEVVRFEDVSGYPTVVVRLANVTAWHGLTLDCALLRQRAEFSDSISEKSLDRVVVGEPAAALFELPERYREAAPSEVKARLFGAASVGPAEAREDEHYRELIRMNTGR